ncbi:MAG: DUF1819 family protein [Blastocatellia bacterium]|nr:DUF1819 family protein [Blastocatellia bacterium]
MYTTQLAAGLGQVDETKTLLELWEPGMSAPHLKQLALASGRFPNVTARRLRNFVTECFAPRYLVQGGPPALYLKQLVPTLETSECLQVFLLFTCRANQILADFIRQVYWDRYENGHTFITNEEARLFALKGIEAGKTVKQWSEKTIRHVAGYITGCCGDLGLLERGSRTRRKILPFYLSHKVSAFLAYDLHCAGVPDQAILTHEDWGLFGMNREAVIEEFKRLARNDFFILQVGGEVVRISWKYREMKEVCHVLAQN